ncbi:GNAT family N-acetyltransferase [Nakamurella sp.]|uniref:GNAT family N-acetyltransferase n=1 Tax=Nakamurella sp. TaxID=1869182 RepID=UPI003B3B8671
MTKSSTIALPSGFTARDLTPADVPAVTDLLAAWERAEPDDHAYTETEIREEFASPVAVLDGGGVAVLRSGRLVGYGLLHVIAREPGWLAYADGGVHPDVHRRGIGGWLLARQLELARTLRDVQAAGRPGELRIGAAERRPGAIAAIVAAGFEPRRYFFRMRADLRGPSPDPVPDPPGVRIRPFVAGDDDAVRLASNDSFADHWGSVPRDPDTWRSEYTDSITFRAGMSFVAEDVTGIVGFSLASEHDADTATRGHRTGYVSRVGTVRAVRGRGVGSALVARSLAAMRSDGYAEAELDVDADSPTGAGRLYERLGFAVVSRERLYVRDL